MAQRVADLARLAEDGFASEQSQTAVAAAPPFFVTGALASGGVALIAAAKRFAWTTGL
jgi:hypothetical protein